MLALAGGGERGQKRDCTHLESLISQATWARKALTRSPMADARTQASVSLVTGYVLRFLWPWDGS